MATTRFISKDGLRIIDEHADGKNYFYFADRRMDGFAIRYGPGSSDLATPSQNVADYNQGITEADKPYSHADIIDGGVMAPVRRQRWNRTMLLEWFAWPAVQRIEASWTTENNTRKRENVEGCLVAYGFDPVEATAAATAYIPGGVKPTQADLSLLTNLPAELRDLMDCSEQNPADDFSVEIEARRTGRRKNDLRKALADIVRMRELGWIRVDLVITEDDFCRITLEREAADPQGPTGKYESVQFSGEADELQRNLQTLCDKIYLCAKGANDAP